MTDEDILEECRDPSYLNIINRERVPWRRWEQLIDYYYMSASVASRASLMKSLLLEISCQSGKDLICFFTRQASANLELREQETAMTDKYILELSITRFPKAYRSGQIP